MPSLFVIENALSDLFDTRQELIDEIAYTDEQVTQKSLALDQINLAIKQYVVAEVRKVDGIAAYLRELNARQLARELEINRLEGLNAADAGAEERIKAICLECLNEDKLKRYEGKLGTLRRQNNGGVLAVEIVQPDLVPDDFKRITITMPLDIWDEIEIDLPNMLAMERENIKFGKPEPDLTAIRKELEKRVPCPECDGSGEVDRCGAGDNTDVFLVPCGLCGGQKTVSSGVPGCRLLERGEHLRVG